MIVATCQIELDIPGMTSLKQKRSVIKSLVNQVHRKFNVSAAEVGLNDVWQSGVLGVVVASNNAVHAEHVVENVVRWIEEYRPDVMVVDYHIESMHF